MIGGWPSVHAGAEAGAGLLGGTCGGEAELLRGYVRHCIALPLGGALLISVHFWRIRKDGGISGPL